ncbi:MAG: ABC transporter ATP-binding protein, partial [Planctomycetes bacterium]|nr:ABC transporter ATP-binding protein [Planctomycetota bacterium]
VGHVALQAETEGGRTELLRGTNSFSARIARIAKSLNDTCKDGKPLEFDFSDVDERHCPSCGKLLPEVGSFCRACMEKRKILARIWHYVKPYWRRLVLIMTCTISVALLSLVAPYLIKILTDDVLLADGGARLLLLLVLVLVAVRSGSLLIGIIGGRLLAWFNAQVVRDVRLDFFQAVQGLCLRRYDKTQTGALVSRLTHDTQHLSLLFRIFGQNIVPGILQLVGICGMLFYLNWQLALIVLVPAPLVMVLTKKFYRIVRRYYSRVGQRQARMSARAIDSISGIRVVKAFAQEPSEMLTFQGQNERLCQATGLAGTMDATYFPIIGFLISFGSFLVWYFGGLRVIRDSGEMTVGSLLAYLAYLGMFYHPLQMFTRMGGMINRAIASAQRLFEITDADQEVYNAPDAKPVKSVAGAIRFEDVHFGYVIDKPVLKGMTMDVRPGEMIGLVGRSGVGKTTITNLLCRFYDIDDGSILLDGTDLRDLKLRDLRRHIGIVPQESYLFNATIAENIAYANPEATQEDVFRAAAAANAHGFIMRLPDGYDTRTGERGAALSGGERQRIAIARAILCDPRILILDEATSSVDTETEELIQEALRNLVKNRTTFAIAHRLSTLKRADRLLVIEDGKVAEFGTHEELMEKKGTFYNLVQLQSRLSAIKAVDG